MRARLVDIMMRLQTFTRVDMRSAVSGGFYLSLIPATSALFGLAITAAFANLVPVDIYGTYKYVLAAYTLLAIAALPGLDTAVLQSVSRGFDTSYLSGMRLKVRWSFLGTAAALIYAAYNYLEGDAALGAIFIIVALALPFMETMGLYTSFLNGKRRYKTWAIVDIVTQALSAVTLVGTMFLTHNPIMLMVAYFFPHIIARAITTIWTMRRVDTQTQGDSGVAPYGRSLTFFQITSRVVASADQIVLYHMLGPAAVAIFSLATAVPMRLQSLFRVSGVLAFPNFANRSGKEITASLPRKMLLFGLIILVACVSYAILAPLLFAYIFPKYMPSLLLSQVVVFYTLSAVSYPVNSYLLSHKKLAANYMLTIGGFFVKMVSLIVFVPLYGVWGAIIGILATGAANIIFALIVIYRERRNPPPENLGNELPSIIGEL